MELATIRIDLAKNVFQVHAVNEHGKARLVRKEFDLDVHPRTIERAFGVKKAAE
jgi:hypothetical protein